MPNQGLAGRVQPFIASLKSPRSASGSTCSEHAIDGQHRCSSSTPGLAQHPGRDLVLVPGMADADAQAVELAVPEVRDGVAQAVLAAVAAVELEPRGPGGRSSSSCATSISRARSSSSATRSPPTVRCDS
jgi:hypothetical protein